MRQRLSSLGLFRHLLFEKAQTLEMSPSRSCCAARRFHCTETAFSAARLLQACALGRAPLCVRAQELQQRVDARTLAE
eukprot:1966286-Pleurochrysis_carterae.AAC.1